MAEHHDWLQVTLDQNHRRGLAETIEQHTDPSNDARPNLLRILRSSRNELLFDRGQGELVLTALNVDKQLPALRARLEAFLADR
jgi:hypothetical protein